MLSISLILLGPSPSVASACLGLFFSFLCLGRYSLLCIAQFLDWVAERNEYDEIRHEET